MAALCITLQHTATHCNTLQHTAPHCTTLHHTAPHCTTLEYKATDCNKSGAFASTHCNATHSNKSGACCSAFASSTPPEKWLTTSPHCNTLQNNATHCSKSGSTRLTLHYTATRCNTLQNAAKRCNTLQQGWQLSPLPQQWRNGIIPLPLLLQCVAVWYSVVQCGAVSCRGVRFCCSVLQRVAVHSPLQEHRTKG